MKTPDADGLILEPQVAEHAAAMFDVLSDPPLYDFEMEPPAPEEWLRARFPKLETRRSPDGRERWLNWVIRLAGGLSIGYVQAAVRDDGSAGSAYALSSSCWRNGFARAAAVARVHMGQQLYGFPFPPPAGNFSGGRSLLTNRAAQRQWPGRSIRESLDAGPCGWVRRAIFYAR